VGYTHYHFIGNLSNHFASFSAAHSDHWATNGVINVKTQSTLALTEVLSSMIIMPNTTGL
jgi:hypothetical protein